MQYRKTLFFLFLLISFNMSAQNPPKKEFRGAWIQTVFQGEYAKMSVEEMKSDFIWKLDQLKNCGFNALIFQVRPEADAWYKSGIEPWSRFLTGRQGQAPVGDFDPMAFLISECHKRCMEFHAWLNPYRAASSNGMHLTPDHICRQHPEWFFSYNNYLYFKPSLKESRDFICRVVRDIVSRYDVDAIHMDDYFYPYPSPGNVIPDAEDFRADPRGFTDIGDWRRDNVNRLIYAISKYIKMWKPWVRFGISPFGIYRNKSSWAEGSNTNGLENYDDLYADILLWTKNGWIDYVIPQIYWEIGHPQADYATLADWWERCGEDCQLYYGLDVARTMKAGELPPKMASVRSKQKVSGYCFWPANEIFWNNGGIADSLKNRYYIRPALVPEFSDLGGKKPDIVSKIQVSPAENGWLKLSWMAKGDRNNPNTAKYFVVYAFAKKGRKTLGSSGNIMAVTPYTTVELKAPLQDAVFVVTAVNRYNIESPGRELKIKSRNLKRLHR